MLYYLYDENIIYQTLVRRGSLTTGAFLVLAFLDVLAFAIFL
jgi:hypothetical protein